MAKKETAKEREARWQAESDYETLVRYEEIKSDSKRLEAAKKIAKERQNEIMKVLKSVDKKEG